MSYTAEGLTSEINEATRAHYASGHHDLDTALIRIQNGGFVSITRDRAAEILRQPISAEAVKGLTGRDVTQEQITLRLAEVTA
jgi:hypothetical protein